MGANDVTADLHWSDSQTPAATERSRAKLTAEPRAIAARHNSASDRVIVDLTSGATFAFPPSLVEFMQDATPEQQAKIEVQCAGFGLHRQALDVNYTVTDLMNGIFGTARWTAGRAGQAKPNAKA